MSPEESLMADTDRLAAVAAEAFRQRVEPGLRLADDAGRVAAACYDMAVRFHRGGKLLVFGNGGPATDAQHIAVEFVHPVIVGKRALPALSLVNDVATVMGVARRYGVDEVFAHQLRVLGAPMDIALGVSADGNCPNVLRGLETAHDAGMLTVALTGGDGGTIGTSPAVDHCFVVRSDNPRIVKEVHVTTYHVLWELVHVFFDQPQTLEAPVGEIVEPVTGGVESLYPFLYAGTTSLPTVLAEVSRSTVEKANEIVALRAAVGGAECEQIARCAGVLAERFGAGGKILAFGNGGSSTDASDIVHTFFDPNDAARPLPALCLTNDAAVLTALSNDVSFDVVFARQIRAFGRAGDIAVGISTSGGSANVLRAFDEARAEGLATVGLAGYGGGKMAELNSLDFLFAIPSSSVHRVQEVQTTLYHVLWEVTQAALQGQAPAGAALAASGS